MANVFTRKHKYPLVVSHEDYKDGRILVFTRPKKVNSESGTGNEPLVKPIDPVVFREWEKQKMTAGIEKIQKENWTCGKYGFGQRGVAPEIKYDTSSTHRHEYADPAEVPGPKDTDGKTRWAFSPDVYPALGIIPGAMGQMYKPVTPWTPSKHQ